MYSNAIVRITLYHDVQYALLWSFYNSFYPPLINDHTIALANPVITEHTYCVVLIVFLGAEHSWVKRISVWWTDHACMGYRNFKKMSSERTFLELFPVFPLLFCFGPGAKTSFQSPAHSSVYLVSLIIQFILTWRRSSTDCKVNLCLESTTSYFHLNL